MPPLPHCSPPERQRRRDAGRVCLRRLRIRSLRVRRSGGVFVGAGLPPPLHAARSALAATPMIPMRIERRFNGRERRPRYVHCVAMMYFLSSFVSCRDHLPRSLPMASVLCLHGLSASLRPSEVEHHEQTTQTVTQLPRISALVKARYTFSEETPPPTPPRSGEGSRNEPPPASEGDRGWVTPSITDGGLAST
jgi:hypothetical protein